MQNNVPRVEIENAMQLCGVDVVSSDFDKIVGKLTNNSIVLVYMQTMCVEVKPFIKMDNDTPVVTTGKYYYYTDIESFISVMDFLNK